MFRVRRGVDRRNTRGVDVCGGGVPTRRGGFEQLGADRELLEVVHCQAGSLSFPPRGMKVVVCDLLVACVTATGCSSSNAPPTTSRHPSDVFFEGDNHKFGPAI